MHIRYLLLTIIISIGTANTAPKAAKSLDLTQLVLHNAFSEEGKKLLRSLPNRYTEADILHSILMGRKEKYTPNALYPERVSTITGYNYWRSYLSKAPDERYQEIHTSLTDRLEELAAQAHQPESVTPQNTPHQRSLIGTGMMATGGLLSGIFALRLIYATTKSPRKRAAARLAIKKLFSKKTAATIAELPPLDQQTIALTQRRIWLNTLGIITGLGLVIGGKYA